MALSLRFHCQVMSNFAKLLEILTLNVNDDNSKKLGTISFEDTNLEDTIPIETLEKKIHAENLLNFKDGVTAAISNSGRIRTVKNISSSYHLNIARNEKNRNILECKYKSFTWYNVRYLNVTVACGTGISFGFFSEIKKKLNLKEKKKVTGKSFVS